MTEREFMIALVEVVVFVLFIATIMWAVSYSRHRELIEKYRGWLLETDFRLSSTWEQGVMAVTLKAWAEVRSTPLGMEPALELGKFYCWGTYTFSETEIDGPSNHTGTLADFYGVMCQVVRLIGINMDGWSAADVKLVIDCVLVDESRIHVPHLTMETQPVIADVNLCGVWTYDDFLTEMEDEFKHALLRLKQDAQIEAVEATA